MLDLTVGSRFGGTVEAGELGRRVESGSAGGPARILPEGASARWTR